MDPPPPSPPPPPAQPAASAPRRYAARFSASSLLHAPLSALLDYSSGILRAHAGGGPHHHGAAGGEAGTLAPGAGEAVAVDEETPAASAAEAPAAGGGSGESPYHRYDVQRMARWVEHALPFSLLLLGVFIRQHLQAQSSRYHNCSSDHRCTSSWEENSGCACMQRREGPVSLLCNLAIMPGKTLVVVEFVSDVGDEDWEKFYSSASCNGRGNTVVIISRLEKLARFGTVKPIRLHSLSHEQYSYLFKQLAFGSANPEDHPHLASVAKEFPTLLSGSLVSANAFANVLRKNMNVKFCLKKTSVLFAFFSALQRLLLRTTVSLL